MSVERIRSLNDQFRSTFVGGAVLLTAGVQTLDEDSRRTLLREIRSFNRFGEGNDPHGEHDFGAIDLNGSKFFWKLDYYDLAMNAGSEDPSDPAKTQRVMTVMRADEY